jgi:hypothetical protein
MNERERQNAFDQLKVMYIAGGQALLRYGGDAGLFRARSYVVRQGERVKLFGRWVRPEIDDGAVMLYENMNEELAGGRAARIGKREVVWSGVVEAIDSSIQQPSSALVQPAVSQPAVGTAPTSPSQRSVK